MLVNVIVDTVVITCVLVTLPDVNVLVTGHEVTVVWIISVVNTATVVLGRIADFDKGDDIDP